MLVAENCAAVEFTLVECAGFVEDNLLFVVGFGAGFCVLEFAHAPVRNEQLRNLFLARQDLYIRRGARFRRQAPVVDGGNFPGTVDILKIFSVLLENVSRDRAHGGAVFVVVHAEAVGCFLSHGF